MSFENLNEGCGALGESIFTKHMTDAHYLVYKLQNGYRCPRCDFRAYNVGKYHHFDFFCCKPSNRLEYQMKNCFFAEVKTKTSSHPLNDQYNEIGFNWSDWTVYLQIDDEIKQLPKEKQIHLWVVFVDRDKIYGAPIRKMREPLEIGDRVYPRKIHFGERTKHMDIDKHMAFFSKTIMKPMGKLSIQEQNKLKNVASKQSTFSMPTVNA